MESSHSSPDDWTIKRCVFADADEVARVLANSIIEHFNAASREIGSAGASPSQIPVITHTGGRGSHRAVNDQHTNRDPQPTAIMLAGGRTPRAAYHLVAESAQTIPPNLHFAISDERYVPAHHADSNALMMEPLLKAIQCPEAQRLFVNTALSCEAATDDFGERLDAFFINGGKLAACYLGLGRDGHTASLFSRNDLARCEGKSAISVDRPDGRVGISATPGIFRRAEKIVFVVTGADKKIMAGNLLKSPTTIIAGRVANHHPHVELWVDRAANPDP